MYKWNQLTFQWIKKQGQKQQQSNFFSINSCDGIMTGDLLTYYSLELAVQFNVAIGPVCRPLTSEGGGGRQTGARACAWVGLEILFEFIY